MGSVKPCLGCGATGDIRYAGVPQRCRECHKAAVKANRSARAEYYLRYDRKRHRENPERRAESHRHSAQWRKDNPEKVAEKTRKDRDEHPEKYRARTAVGNALRDGKLTRQPCEVCAEPKTHGHHDDYSKLLDVRWLCAPCHAEHHVKERGL